jgi:hypothetical protein
MNNPYDDNHCCVSCGYIFCEIKNKCIRPWLEECSNNRRLQMASYTIEELGMFITIVGAVLTGCIAVIIKSRCKTIDTPCVKCKREILHEKNEIIKENTPTPRENIDLEP